MSELMTPLYERHLHLGAKMAPFAGYLMPIEYQGIPLEHLAVRTQCGLFDVSHMGEIRVKGEEALPFLDFVTTNRIQSNALGKVVYTILCTPEGTVIDDLLVYGFAPQEILLIVNASNTEKDFSWLSEQSKGWKVTLTNESPLWGEIALQGPLAEMVLSPLLNHDFQNLSFMRYEWVPWAKGTLLISRTGYTGEDGFEIYGSPEVIVALWDALLKDSRVTPCGLGCRDTLRFEATLPLYGHEISDTISPLEAGLGFAVKFDKDFIGKEPLLKQKESLPRHLVGLKLIEKGIARQGYPVWDNDAMCGFITTGYQLPGQDSAIALALVNTTLTVGDEVSIQIRQKRVKALICEPVFMTKRYKRP